VGHGDREVIYAKDASTFKTVLNRLRAAPRGVVAVDTEFVGFPQYRPRLALVQLATADMVAAVDPLAVPAEAIKELIRVLCLPDPSELTYDVDDDDAANGGERQLELVLHANSMDMMVFYDALDVAGGAKASPSHSGSLSASFGARMTSRIFDTQVAAAFTGYGNMIGYGNLIEAVFGLKLDKGEQTSNWLRRPLSASQIDYALNDVIFLIELRDRLVEELGAAKAEWLRGEMEPLQLLDMHAPPDPAHAWRSVRRWQRLEPRQQAVLRELTAWREKAGRSGNRAPLLLINDNTLGDLAKVQPTTDSDLERCVADMGLKQFTARNHGVEIIAAVKRGLDIPDAALHDALAWPPIRSETTLTPPTATSPFVPNSFLNHEPYGGMVPMMGHLLSEKESAVFHLMMCHIHSVAAKHGIAGELLGQPQEMQRYAKKICEDAERAREQNQNATSAAVATSDVNESAEGEVLLESPALPDIPLRVMGSWRYDVAGRGLEEVLAGSAALHISGTSYDVDRVDV